MKKISIFLNKPNKIIGSIANTLAILAFIATVLIHFYGKHVLLKYKTQELENEIRKFRLINFYEHFADSGIKIPYPTGQRTINTKNISIEEIKLLFNDDKFCTYILHKPLIDKLYDDLANIMKIYHEKSKLFSYLLISRLLLIGFILVVYLNVFKKT